MISEPLRAASKYLSDLLQNGTPAALSDTELLTRFAARHNEHDGTAGLAFAALMARHGPIALMEVAIKSTTNAGLMLTAAVFLIAGLVTAGAGAMGYSETRQQNLAPPRDPAQQSRPSVAASQTEQDRPRAAPRNRPRLKVPS